MADEREVDASDPTGESAAADVAATPPEDGEGTVGRLAAIWDQVSTLLLAIVLALVIRAVLIEPFRIPSESMLPTLLVGDHLFVNKLLYGARIPFTNWRLPAVREPERGDVVVFEVGRDGPFIFPADQRPDLVRDDFVKRIVGLPGDEVAVRDGRVFINGERLERIASDEIFVDRRGSELDVYQEDLLGCGHAVLDDPTRVGQERKAFEIGPNRYFMMGDNRDGSNDSRGWGTVHFDDFKGPAFVLYWSWDVEGNFLQFLDPRNWWNAEKRWDRLFQRVRCDPAR